MGLIVLACLHWQNAGFIDRDRCNGIFSCQQVSSGTQAVEYVNNLPKDQRRLVQFQEGRDYTAVYYCDQFDEKSKK